MIMVIVTKTVHILIPDNELLSLHVVRKAVRFMAVHCNRSQTII